MLDNLAMPIICAAEPNSFTTWFASLKELFNHPYLDEEEKSLWLWLANQSANNLPFSCSYSYEQLSQAVNKTPRRIHRILMRLRVMGFLIADLPIYYGEPTREMVATVHHLKLITTPTPITAMYDEQHHWVVPIPNN